VSEETLVACSQSILYSHPFQHQISTSRATISINPIMPLCEETPLLYDNGHECGKIKEHDLAYERFNPRQKRILLAIVSWCGLMPRMHSNVDSISPDN